MPLPTSFVVKKGSKMWGMSFRGNAGAGVLHGQAHKIPGARFWMSWIGSRFKGDLFGGDLQLPAARHGIAGVDDQIDEHLFQHADVGLHRRQRG